LFATCAGEVWGSWHLNSVEQFLKRLFLFLRIPLEVDQVVAKHQAEVRIGVLFKVRGQLNAVTPGVRPIVADRSFSFARNNSAASIKMFQSLVEALGIRTHGALSPSKCAFEARLMEIEVPAQDVWDASKRWPFD
jgi:hypothetical protein